MRIHLAAALALVALASSAWGADRGGWFHVSWGPEPEGKTPTPRIAASVRNDSPYRVTDVQLEVEGTQHRRTVRGPARRVGARGHRVGWRVVICF